MNISPLSSIEESLDINDLLSPEFLLQLSQDEEGTFLNQHGYKKIRKIADTLQGDIWECESSNSSSNPSPSRSLCPSPTRVAIKRTDKCLYEEKITIQDDTNFIVSENIIKESIILKHLTYDNQPIGDSIVKYIDFIESDTDYYLIQEYIDYECTLSEFVHRSHEYIKHGQLNLTKYQKIIKFIFWQLSVATQWMHHDMKCCHLDLCLENILLINADFIESKNEDGSTSVNINHEISIKLVDFGNSELFRTKSTNDKSKSDSMVSFRGSNDNDNQFLCSKQHLSINNEGYLSPNYNHDNFYDARKSDSWSLGVILYYMLIGEYPYNTEDMFINKKGSGYWALQKGQLQTYLEMNNLLKFLTPSILSLLKGLLNTNENRRYDLTKVIKHRWFKSYFNIYEKKIKRKSILQTQKLSEQEDKMDKLLFYYN